MTTKTNKTSTETTAAPTTPDAFLAALDAAIGKPPTESSTNTWGLFINPPKSNLICRFPLRGFQWGKEDATARDFEVTISPDKGSESLFSSNRLHYSSLELRDAVNSWFEMNLRDPTMVADQCPWQTLHTYLGDGNTFAFSVDFTPPGRRTVTANLIATFTPIKRPPQKSSHSGSQTSTPPQSYA